MKIKQKKQLNLSQLIEWGFEKGITNEEYVCNEHKSKSVIFNLLGWAEFSDEFSYNPHDTFTVTTEEEITEDTPLSMIIECDEDSSFWVFENTTLKNLHGNKCVEETTKYYRDDEENMHLIWRDGKLVE